MRRCSPDEVSCCPVCNHCRAYQDDDPSYPQGGSAGEGTCRTTGKRTDPGGDCEHFHCWNVPEGEEGYR